MNTHTDSNRSNTVADALGLGTIADAEAGASPDLLRDLYRHARNEDGKRIMFEKDATFAKGWVNLGSPRAVELISAFVAMDDARDIKQARRNAQNNLEAQSWNDVLCIDQPPISCKVKIHGSKWGLRFMAGDTGLRGREILNEDLPPIPLGRHAADADAAAPGASEVPPGAEPKDPQASDQDPAEDVTTAPGADPGAAPPSPDGGESQATATLRAGGMPT